MTRNFGFVFNRSTKQNIEDERIEILRYSYTHRILIDRIFTDMTLVDVAKRLQNKDTIIVVTLKDVLKTQTTIGLLESGIKFFCIKESIWIESVDDFARLTNKKIPSNNEIDSDKKRPGRKAGILIHSGFDDHLQKIKELHSLGLSLEKICKNIGFGTKQSLSYYLKSRGIDNQKVS